MALNKEELQNYFKTLDDSFSEYLIAYRLWKTGSNAAKRDSGFKDAERIIARVKGIIESDDLLFDLASQPTNYYDGFMSTRHFDTDMPKFLRRIEDSLKAFN